MQQYFVKETIQPHHTINDSSIIHHLVHVMRSSVGDVFVLCDDQLQCYHMQIDAISANTIKATRQYKIKHERHPLNITLAQALIRKEKFELVLQKATELGLKRLIPLMSERSVVKLTKENTEKKLKRFDKITQEASEQSRRHDVVEILTPQPLDALPFDAYDHVVVAYEDETSKATKNVLKSFTPNEDVLVLVGPEGGFSEEEIAHLKTKGAKSISLGPRILRSETAALYILSAISYETEMSE